MTEEELAALRSAHGDVCAVRARDGKVLFVVRAITKTELVDFYDETPSKAQQGIAKKCLLWPSEPEFKELIKQQSALITHAFRAVRKVSGEQCEVEMDEKAGKATATVQRGEADPERVYQCGKLGYAQYQRFLDGLQSGVLSARCLACVDAGTWPERREERIALFERWPYLADIMIAPILLFSGGDADLEGN